MAETKDLGTEDQKASSQGAENKPEEKKGKNGMKIIILVVISFFIIAGGITVFLFLTESGRHMAGLDKKKEGKEEKEISPETLTFYKMPELMVNLVPAGKKTPFLRLGIKLELPNAEAQKTIDLLLPRVIDQFQMYLRELRMEDIEGSAGIHRLREELLKRVNAVSAPLKVKDVLFEVLLVQ